MKLHGVKIEGRHTETIFVPRGDDDGFMFMATAIQSLDRFAELCPEPKPPVIHRPGKAPQADTGSRSFIEAMTEHNRRRLGYMVMETLRGTEGLEYEILDSEKPETWSRYEEEFLASGFTQMEVNNIISGVLRVNSLDPEHIRAARDRFLALREAAEKGDL